MSTYTMSQTMYTLYCAKCSIWFGIPKDFEERRRNDHASFYCPAGHVNVYDKESDEEKFRRERDIARQQLARVEDEKREALKVAEKAKKETKQLKKRAASGTCPCCQRSFANMAEHMKQQHPQFVRQTGAKVIPMKAAK